ncbi:hypothetical protein FPSE5266_05596 [Fusarium pseudograminearum]|nr:hypothetical protein FPSE5266_05596 [Fusarium pseudograminearum]
MNGAQSQDAQKAVNANSNGSNSNNSSLAAKKRKKDLKPIITMEDTSQTDGKLKAKRMQIRKDAEPRVKESKPKTRSTPPTSG